MKKTGKKFKYSLPKIFRITYLSFGITILAFLFFYSPKLNHHPEYSFTKTIANKLFLDKISYFIMPEKIQYSCGNKIVNVVDYSRCWADYFDKRPQQYFSGYKIQIYDYPFLSKKPLPREIDKRYRTREFWRGGLSIILFGISVFYLWRFREKVVNSLLSFYKKI